MNEFPPKNFTLTDNINSVSGQLAKDLAYYLYFTYAYMYRVM